MKLRDWISPSSEISRLLSERVWARLKGKQIRRCTHFYVVHSDEIVLDENFAIFRDWDTNVILELKHFHSTSTLNNYSFHVGELGSRKPLGSQVYQRFALFDGKGKICSGHLITYVKWSGRTISTRSNHGFSQLSLSPGEFYQTFLNSIPKPDHVSKVGDDDKDG
jgi:hypothetical protein